MILVTIEHKMIDYWEKRRRQSALNRNKIRSFWHTLVFGDWWSKHQKSAEAHEKMGRFMFQLAIGSWWWVLELLTTPFHTNSEHTLAQTAGGARVSLLFCSTALRRRVWRPGYNGSVFRCSKLRIFKDQFQCLKSGWKIYDRCPLQVKCVFRKHDTEAKQFKQENLGRHMNCTC